MKKKGVFLTVLCGILLILMMTPVIINAENVKSQSLKVTTVLERKPEVALPIVVNAVYPLSEVNNNFVTYEYVYTTLDEEHQAAYRKIVQTIEQHKNGDYQEVDFSEKLLICEIDLSEYRMNADEMVGCLWSVLSDHTEYFFVSDDVYYYLGEDTEEKVLYVMASDECGEEYIKEEVYNTLDCVLADIRVNVSEMNYTYEKVRYIDNYIREYFTYALDHNSNPEVNDKTSSIASILGGRAICAGYGRINHFFLNQLGINTIYVTGMADGGYHAWNYIFIEEENQWYASDVTFSDGGDEILLKGKEILKTHKPLRDGMSDVGFGYPLPKLSDENFVFEDDKTEEPGENVDDPDINLGNNDADNKNDNINDSSEGGQDEFNENLPDTPEAEEDLNSRDENNDKVENEGNPDNNTEVEGEEGPVDEGDTDIGTGSENGNELENGEVGISIFEENTNGKTYRSDMGIILPINPDMNSWVEVGMYMEEIDITMDDGSITKGWVGIPVPEDTMYKWDGEAYINGMSADLFYTYEAMKSDNTSVKIGNYKEACKYNPTDAGLYFNIGCCYSSEGNYEEAFVYYMEAIRRGDTTGAVDNILSLIETHKDETERQGEYLKVLEIVPNDERVLNKVSY